MICSLVRWGAALSLSVSMALACGGAPSGGSPVRYSDVDELDAPDTTPAGSQPGEFELQLEKALTAKSWDRDALEKIASKIEMYFKRGGEPLSFSQLVARAKLLHILTELQPDPEKRQPWVETGLLVARQLSSSFPDHVESPYYLAIFLGRQAQNQGLSALATVKKVEKLALSAVEKDPSFDSAGPLRVLAMLYLRAPAWPVSIGDIDRARDFAVEAIDTADVPTNWIVLAEVLAEDGEEEKAQSLVKKALDAEAGPAWEQEKVIWEPRALELLHRLQ